MAMAGTLIALYAVAAIWNVSTWVASGIESQRFASAVPRLLQSVPRGSVVLVERARMASGWLVLVLGNAVRAAASVYGRRPVRKFKIVERPPVYCCPPDQWWAARKATLMALMDSPAPQQVTYIVFAPETRERPRSPHERSMVGP